MCWRKITFLTVTTDEDFLIDGAKIFEGIDTGETCIVRDPVYKKRYEASICEVQGNTCTFKVAIVEFAMCAYGIYLVKDRAGARKKKDKRNQMKYAASIAGYLAVIGAVLTAVTMFIALELEKGILPYLLPIPFFLLFLVSTILYLVANTSKKKKSKEDISATAIYLDALEGEKEWRKNASQNDLELLDQTIKQFHEIGITYINTFSDIIYRKITDKSIIEILNETILKWDDLGIEVQLIGVIGVRGNTKATERIIRSYERISESQRGAYIFYDDALKKIADKRYKDVYLKWARSWKDLANLGMLMNKMAVWGIEEGKDIFLEQLFSTEDIDQYDPNNYANLRMQAYMNALTAVSKYTDTDGRIESALQKVVKETDSKYLKEFALKGLEDLKRDYDSAQYLYPDIMR